MAYFAGGCVRDELLGLAPSDYDVATDATPDRIAALFPRSSHVGAAFGVMLVHPPHPPHLPHANHDVVEVATFRSDGAYTDKRRPDAVTFSTPEEDARRRDFTVNALFLDPFDAPRPSDAPLPSHWKGGRIIDFVGGVVDLHARVLRAVGDPAQRLAEDHLRALRAVRLASRLGFAIDPGTADAIRSHAADLEGVSRERIGDEVRRMFAHPSRAAAAGLLRDLSLEKPVLMDPVEPRSLRGPATTLGGLASNVGFGVALAGWAVDLGVGFDTKSVQAFADRARRALCLSNEERWEVGAALESVTTLRGEWVSLNVAKQKRFAVTDACVAGMHVLSVVDPVAASAVRLRIDELAVTPSGLGPAPILTGDDLVAMGLRPGPRFKAILDGVYDAQLEDRVTNMAEARELVGRLCV